MSKIDRLSILGVRSFDNTRSETIQFYAPLTLIVGLNGSGKTTIIECLKYATTGELPPNAKVGGAFIHDPKLCGEKEVLAQVKVSFKSKDGFKMVCTRNLQLTVKKNSRSMKTLEGNLLISKHGERTTISTRVAEMDVRYKPKWIKFSYLTEADRRDLNQTQMPYHLGVSKAILESVIFCHQEESLWPLSEPAKLKVRFDEIFEAQKYTKAIENIKLIQKGKKDALKLMNKDEEVAKANKDRADKNKKQTMKLHAELDTLRAKIEQKGDDIRDATTKAEEAWKLAEEAGVVVANLEGKRIAENTKIESVESLRENLVELTDSDEELQKMLEQYEERVQAFEEDVDHQKQQYHDLQEAVDDARGRVSAKERECGSYEAQQQSHERQIANRGKLVKETARSHSIRGFDTDDATDAQVKDFMDRISKMARDQNAALERMRQETNEQLQVAQKDISDINEKKSALNSRKESSRQTIASNDQQITRLQHEVNKIQVDEGSNVALEAHLRETETKREGVIAQIAAANWDSTIDADEAELRKLDDRKEKLDIELVEGTRQAGDTARLDHMQKELKDRQRSLETMMGAHGEQIKDVVGNGWTPATLENDYRRAVEHQQSQLSDAERQRDGTNGELQQIEYKLKTHRDELKSKKATIKSAENAIREATDGEPSEYLEQLEEMEKSRDVHKSDADAFSKVVEYFDACIKIAQEANACRTCSRNFAGRKERDQMLAVVMKEKKKYDGASDVKAQLADVERDLHAAKAVSSQFDTWKRLTEKEVPQLLEQEKRVAANRETLISQLETRDANVQERQSAKRDVEALSRNVQNIVKYNNDIASFETQIKELTAKQKAAGMSRGLEVIQADSKSVNEQAKIVKGRLNKTIADRDRTKAHKNQLDLEISDTKSKLNTTRYQLKEKQALEDQASERKRLNEEERGNVKSIDQQLQDLVPKLSQAQAKYQDVSQRGADKDRDQRTQTDRLNNSVNQLKMASQEITSYIERGGPDQLKRGKREADEIRAEIANLEAEKGRVLKEIKQLEDQLRNHADTKRSIADNQRYRRDVQQLKDIRGDITKLEATNAEAEKANNERQGSIWQQRRNAFAAEQATLVGEMKSKDDQFQALVKDWEVEYKGAARNYRETHIKVETTKACVDDLGRYMVALDQAILKYHAVKMEEINSIIGDLWRKTYQGTDVDTILIRSESEPGKTNKSYNYRVCMMKQDAEMDMRGRCSAGQKVLACIIIRLALAECFGVNCGLIALDEPTTNLDRDNIRALAESLGEIIKLRRVQANFQLIVITHDEDFLRQMNCNDYADSYWRVSRNEKMKSMIEKQDIADVS